MRCLTSRGMLAGGVEAAVEAATGGVGAGALTAARPLGCSPAHLAVPHIPRHAGGVEAAVEAATGGAGAGAPTAADAECDASKGRTRLYFFR